MGKVIKGIMMFMIAQSKPKLPKCPHCKAPLTVEEIRSLIASVRTTSNRKKPRVRETIIPILQFLRRDPANPQKFKEIFDHVTEELRALDMQPKRIATTFALTWLAREHYVENVRFGYWQVTEGGQRVELTPEVADHIERKHDPAFHQQKVLKGDRDGLVAEMIATASVLTR